MKKLLKKLIIYRHKPVVDVQTGKQEIASSWEILGFPLKPTYKPL